MHLSIYPRTDVRSVPTLQGRGRADVVLPDAKCGRDWLQLAPHQRVAKGLCGSGQNLQGAFMTVEVCAAVLHAHVYFPRRGKRGQQTHRPPSPTPHFCIESI